MCGIIGIIGKQPVVPLLVDGLRRLEYRGYDSAGVATINGPRIRRRRAKGKLDRLAEKLADRPIEGHDRHRPHPLGHPRPAQRDQRPPPRQRPGGLVHNGIIENFQELREDLDRGPGTCL